MKLVTLLAVILLAALGSAAQDTTYTYTGHEFDLFEGSYKENPNYFITGSFAFEEDSGRRT
jgi:hypothetical protein